MKSVLSKAVCPSNICFGRIAPLLFGPCVNNVCQGGYSSLKVITTVNGSGASTLAILSYPVRVAGAFPGFMTASPVNLTSSEVKGVPSDQNRQSFSFQVIV